MGTPQDASQPQRDDRERDVGHEARCVIATSLIANEGAQNGWDDKTTESAQPANPACRASHCLRNFLGDEFEDRCVSYAHSQRHQHSGQDGERKNMRDGHQQSASQRNRQGEKGGRFATETIRQGAAKDTDA